MKVLPGSDDHTTTFSDLNFPDSISGHDSYPIYICCHPDSVPFLLESEACQKMRKSYPPSPRLEDFVFLHYDGRLIESSLRKNNVGGSDQTTCLLNLGLDPTPRGLHSHKLVSSEITTGVDSYGLKKKVGRTIVCGKWAGSVKGRVEKAVKECTGEGEGENWEVVDLGFYRDVRRLIFEYCIAASTFNLVGSVHSKTSKEALEYSDVALGYTDECVEMVQELSSCLRGGLAVTMMFGFEDRIMNLGESAPLWKSRPAAVAEAEGFDNTNGWWFTEMTCATFEKAKAANVPLPDPLPMHTEYLGFVGKNVEVVADFQKPVENAAVKDPSVPW